ncbi:MAG: ABC transporter substrate-binding protein [Halieaceae bacterium]|nr:ABC transporter substrate-binding protein [Halieaceae bacterium]
MIGYSDWPGWVAWEVAVEKDWFAEAGVDVRFEWFDYAASMEAFAAGQLDAVTMTNGDTLVTGSSGARSVMILVGDYSNGNDMIVAAPGIDSVAELRGKRVGVEVGFVGHLLLLDALESAGLTEADVEIVNVPTNETPQVLASRDVDAIVAWQPNSGQSLERVPGSTAVYTSGDQPGLIYDVLAVSPQSLYRDRKSWEKVIDVWYRVVDYILDPDTRSDALAIMAARAGQSPEKYARLLEGTRLLSRDEAGQLYDVTEGFDSLRGSTRIADEFNRRYDVYPEPQDIDAYIDGSLLLGE